MAINYGTQNLASSARGAFAIYSVNDTAGGGTINILDGNVATGAVTAIPNAVPLTAIQVSALSEIFKKMVLNVGTVAGNELEYLRKLVGVLSFTSGTT
jgi:hypothetical protein